MVIICNYDSLIVTHLHHCWCQLEQLTLSKTNIKRVTYGAKNAQKETIWHNVDCYMHARYAQRFSGR